MVLLFFQKEKEKQRGGTSKKKITSNISDEDSSSDSSDEEDSPRTLNYRAPLITQVKSSGCLNIPSNASNLYQLCTFPCIHSDLLLLVQLCTFLCPLFSSCSVISY